MTILGDDGKGCSLNYSWENPYEAFFFKKKTDEDEVSGLIKINGILLAYNKLIMRSAVF